jgi:hypothetical protein
MTPAEIRDAVDAKLATLWNAIQNKEATYASNHQGRYWQGLRTHTLEPSDGLELLPTIGLTVPSDQADPWPLAIRTSLLPMSIQIDVYDGPDGVGYVATVRVTINGQIWMRSAQVGPETWRQQGWHQAPSGAL